MTVPTDDGPPGQRAAPLSALVERAFRIRAGEGRIAILMALYLMAIVSTFIVGRTVRDTLFLLRTDIATLLPLTYIASGTSVALGAWLYSRIADRYRRDRLIAISLLLCSALILVFWACIRLRVGSWIYFALYVAVEVIGAISIMQFWTFANDVFSGRQAKRLFGFIGAGGNLANIICGFGIGTLARIIDSEDFLLITGSLFLLCTFLVRDIASRATADLELAVRRPKKKSGIRIAKESERVFGSRHLQIIAGIVVATFLTVTLIDFQFKILVEAYFDEERKLAAYFGYFYATTGIISSIVQIAFTARVLERSGIVVALAILPLALATGVTSILILPAAGAIIAVTMAKGAEFIFRYSINDAAMQLLYVPVPSHRRGRAKAFIDGILKQGSIAMTGVLLLLAVRWLLPPRVLAFDAAFVALGLIGMWLLLIFGIRREYVNSLIETLRSRRLDLNQTWSPTADEETRTLIQKRLQSSSDDEVLNTLEILKAVRGSFHKNLVALLRHENEEVRIRALALIGESGRLDGAKEIHALCRDPSPRIRAAAITAFCAVGRERSIRTVGRFLDDPNGEVRAAAVAAMIQHGGLDGILTAAETLRGFVDSELPKDRLYGARVLRDIKVQNFFQPVLRLLQDDNPQVRVAAVEAAGAMKSPELVPALIYKLADAPVAMAAVRALIAYGANIEPTLFKVLHNRTEDIRVRRRVPRVLERVGGRDAFDHLIRALQTKDPRLRAQVARAAARIRERNPHFRVDPDRLGRAIHEQLRSAYQTLQVTQDLGLPLDHLLSEALLARHQQHLSLAFGLLEIQYPARTIQLVHANLDSENRAIRANALEVVDNVVSSEQARLLLPLLEDHTLEYRTQHGREAFPMPSRTAEEWLEILVEDALPWMVACAIHHIAEQELVQFLPQIENHLVSRNPIVRETALVALTRMLGRAPEAEEKKLNGLRDKVLPMVEDRAPEVRRAAQALLQTVDRSALER